MLCGEPLDLASVSGSSLPGKEGQRPMAGSLELSVRHVDATVRYAVGLVVALSTTSFRGGMEFLNFVCVGSELRRPGCALRLSTHAGNAP